MHSALLISHTETGLENLNALLRKVSIQKVETAKTCGDARNKTLSQSFDLYIINTPVHTESGEDLALELIKNNASQVIILVKNEHYAYIAHKVEDAGVLTIPKPLNKSLVYITLKLAKASWARLQNLQKQKLTLNKKLEDLKLVARAKCILISQFKMSEIEAHKYIEKEAMNSRKERRDIALRILKTYEQ